MGEAPADRGTVGEAIGGRTGREARRTCGKPRMHLPFEGIGGQAKDRPIEVLCLVS
ncbi:MAG: hypothetical protein M1515_01400 [Candidatus Thermoplasmatota archaeon]|nr:hypothetical protein [Candidatus Thermoplasmatota archaeon]